MQPMPKPTGAHVGHLLYLRHVCRGMANFINDMRIHAIQHSRKYLFSALNHDPENRNGNNQTDNRIGQWVPKPDTNHTNKHRQTGPAVDPCMMTVGYERCASNPTPYANAEHCNRFVTDKTNQRRNSDRPKMRNILGMKKSLDTLVAGDNRAEKDREDNRDACQVFDSAIAKCESPVRPLAREQKGDAQRDSCRRVAKIMNGVGQQAHAA